MTFTELDSLESERKYSSQSHNVTLSLVILGYFIVLLILMNMNSEFQVLENILNLVLASVGVYVSYVLKSKNLKKTITSTVYDLLREEFSELNDKNLTDLDSIEVETLRSIGYIFKYKNRRYLYTSIDNQFKKYSV